MKKIQVFISRQIFLVISVAISFYFGFHGFRFLHKNWAWEFEIALATIVLVEAVFLNVFRAKSYSEVKRVPVFIFGFVALAFSVALPLLSSWSEYQKLERVVTATVNVSEPEYFSEKVIPALERELKTAEELIAPRVAEKRRRLKIGDGVYERRVLKNRKIRIITGTEAASWVPYFKDEKARFQKVENLIKNIREYREADKLSKETFDKVNNAATASLKGAQSDVWYGWWAFWFKVGLIVFLGFSSLYYMYSYSVPQKDEDGDKVEKRLPAFISSNPEFVRSRYPDAVGSKVGDLIQIKSNGEILGKAKNAPHAWRNARENIENKKL